MVFDFHDIQLFSSKNVLLLEILSDIIMIFSDMNLFFRKKISLVEALTGVNFSITHLDKRVLNVSFGQNGEIIRPGDVKCIENEGMPQYKNQFSKGGLFVEFDVVFPTDNSFTEADLGVCAIKFVLSSMKLVVFSVFLITR